TLGKHEGVLAIGQTAEQLNAAYTNYNFAVDTGDFTISEQTIDPDDPDNPGSYLNVQVSEPVDVTYNGQHQQSPVTVERLDADGNVIATLVEYTDYTLTYENDVNAGVETAKVIVTGINNYTGTVVKTYTINPAEAMIVVNNNAKVYGEDDPVFQGKVVLYNDGAADQPLYTNVLTEEVDTLGDITYSRTNAGVEDAGTYEGVLTAAVEDGTLNSNYTYEVWPGDFHIAKSDELVAKITTSAKDLTKVYDGKALTLTAEATPSEGSTLMYSTDGGETWSDEVPSITSVGTLDVMVKAVNPNYYDSYPVEATLTVTPATLKVTTPSLAKVFDGTPLTAAGKIEGFVNGETATFTTTGSVTNVDDLNNGVAGNNTYSLVWDGTALKDNYTVVEDLGTLQVFPQSIDPDDPDPDNPDPGDPDPDNPDPENPDQPFFTGATVNDPRNTTYNGTDQAWLPTVVSDEGVTLTQSTDGGETGDYIVSYGSSTINAGHIVVTITGCGNYAGTVTREYNIFPATITVHANNHSKVQGQADPSLTSWYEGAVGNEIPGWTGFISRAAGETPGQYAIGQNTLQLADGQNGFLESNYTLEFVGATFTITPAPVTPGGGDDTPVTPVTPVNPVPGPDDGADDATDDAETEAIDDDETPLTESIEDDDTPLASGREDRDCWVHWFMFVGLAVSAIYYIGALIHRRKFTGDLKSYEDSVLNPDDQNRA
ncbi:MBG domain-containing protein, partial [Collinsella intestinalis]|uniref:MBG domain-containing protein n=1 Tax=Collinsella intestinalis TaxID=147207 RepID=UPI001959DE46